MSVTTPYIYTENGSQLKSTSTSFQFYGWNGFGWIIEFPTSIPNVTEIDFSVLPGNITRTTVSGSGQIRIRVYDDSDLLIGSVNSSTVNATSVALSTLSPVTLTGETVARIEILGPSGSGPGNLAMSSIVDGVSTYNITTEGPSITVVMYSHAVELSWEAVSSATSYEVRMSKDSGDYETIKITSNLTHTEPDLDDGSSYDFEVYSDLDSITPAHISIGNITPTASTAETENLLTLFSNDITSLSEDNVQDIDLFLHDHLSSGEELTSRISFNNEEIAQDKVLTYVVDGGTSLVDNTPILTPFIENNGGTKTFTLTLSDLTSAVFSFNETTNTLTVTIDSVDTILNVGDSFIIDGKIAKISELN